jgi:hypothetical protein
MVGLLVELGGGLKTGWEKRRRGLCWVRMGMWNIRGVYRRKVDICRSSRSWKREKMRTVLRLDLM